MPRPVWPLVEGGAPLGSPKAHPPTPCALSGLGRVAQSPTLQASLQKGSKLGRRGGFGEETKVPQHIPLKMIPMPR